MLYDVQLQDNGRWKAEDLRSTRVGYGRTREDAIDDAQRGSKKTTLAYPWVADVCAKVGKVVLP